MFLYVLKCESRLSLEHKTKLQTLEESLITKHEEKLKEFEDNHKADKKKYEQEVSKLESERRKQLEAFQQECEKLKEELKSQSTKFDTEMGRLDRKYKMEVKQLEEDLTIAKTAAVNQMREEMQKEKQMSLSALEEKLNDEHKDQVEKVSVVVFIVVNTSRGGEWGGEEKYV